MKHNPNFTALIPARSGSKGIKNKNLIKLLNLPLFQHTLNAALESKFIQEVWVSSDDTNILNQAEELGSRILKRPAKYARDDSKFLF